MADSLAEKRARLAASRAAAKAATQQPTALVAEGLTHAAPLAPNTNGTSRTSVGAADDKVAQLRLKRELRKLDGLVASGQMTPAEGEQAKLRLQLPRDPAQSSTAVKLTHPPELSSTTTSAPSRTTSALDRARARRAASSEAEPSIQRTSSALERARARRQSKAASSTPPILESSKASPGGGLTLQFEGLHTSSDANPQTSTQPKLKPPSATPRPGASPRGTPRARAMTMGGTPRAASLAGGKAPRGHSMNASSAVLTIGDGDHDDDAIPPPPGPPPLDGAFGFGEWRVSDNAKFVHLRKGPHPWKRSFGTVRGGTKLTAVGEALDQGKNGIWLPVDSPFVDEQTAYVRMFSAKGMRQLDTLYGEEGIAEEIEGYERMVKDLTNVLAASIIPQQIAVLEAARTDIEARLGQKQRQAQLLLNTDVSDTEALGLKFAHFDENGDGVLDQKELGAMFSELGFETDADYVTEVVKSFEKGGVALAGISTSQFGVLWERIGGDLIQKFRQFDVDNDGKLDKNEVAQLMQDLGYRSDSDYIVDILTNFGEFDTNDSGTIEFDEFTRLWADLTATDVSREMDGQVTPTELRRRFVEFDRDEDDLLSTNEVMDMLVELGHAATEKYVMQLMQDFGQFDEDGSGNIDFDEFQQLWANVEAQQVPLDSAIEAGRPEDTALVHMREMFMEMDTLGTGMATISQLQDLANRAGRPLKTKNIGQLKEKYEEGGLIRFSDFAKYWLRKKTVVVHKGKLGKLEQSVLGRKAKNRPIAYIKLWSNNGKRLLLPCSDNETKAAGHWQVVTPKDVNVRSSPDMKSKILGQLPTETVVMGIEIVNEETWLKVENPFQRVVLEKRKDLETAWVKMFTRKGLEKGLEAIIPCEEYEDGSCSAEWEVTAEVSSLNVRAKSSKYSSKLGVLDPGTVVTTLGNSDDGQWLEIVNPFKGM